MFINFPNALNILSKITYETIMDVTKQFIYIHINDARR